ncbi:hypothetical protein B0H16DRAFT_309527 [Mycena metata]|uniref:Secreted protein n=2 Tax=Mycena metata TaxID=1033252 RepID=A0AAD7P2C0_9AGAR|nr:hypothetical protein B0H16DRAFT_309527 [Mycena metata]
MKECVLSDLLVLICLNCSTARQSDRVSGGSPLRRWHGGYRGDMHRCVMFSSFSSLLNMSFVLISHTSSVQQFLGTSLCYPLLPSPASPLPLIHPHALLHICRPSCYLRGIQLRFCTSNLSL